MYKSGFLGNACNKSVQEVTVGPQYVGDCAIAPDGITSSLQRLEQMAGALKSQTSEIAYFFGLAEPEKDCGPAPAMSPKYRVDAVVDDMNRASEMLSKIQSHLTS